MADDDAFDYDPADFDDGDGDAGGVGGDIGDDVYDYPDYEDFNEDPFADPGSNDEVFFENSILNI